MKTKEKVKDPLDELFLSEEETELFNKGKRQGYIEAKRELERSGKKIRPKLTFDQGRAVFLIKEHEKRIRHLEKHLEDIKKERDNFDRLLAKETEKTRELKKWIKKLKKQKGDVDDEGEG